MGSEEMGQVLGLSGIQHDRIGRLLDRGGQLAIELERLGQLGIWVITRADEMYPRRLKDSLGTSAPPILFGAGNRSILSEGHVAIVGSRDVDEHGAQFASALGKACGEQNITVVSGFARGVDRLSMEGALNAGGRSIGVLAEGLEKTIRSKDVRQFLLAGRLAFVTAEDPQAKFSPGSAMGRNKFIYCLARYGVVVSSSAEKGGTRAGALEVLKKRWVPLLVRTGPNVPDGNLALLEGGAIPFPPERLEKPNELSHWFEAATQQWTKGKPLVDVGRPKEVEAPTDFDLFEIVWPHIEQVVRRVHTPQRVAFELKIELRQAESWLSRAVKVGRLTYSPDKNEFTLPRNHVEAAQLHFDL